MNRNGGVIALTVVGVLVAGGAAAALNTVVLGSGTQASVAPAERFLASGRSPLSPIPGSSPATTAPVVTEDSVAVSDSPAPSASRVESTDDRGASTPQATRTSTDRATVARVSPTHASPSESETESHGGSSEESGGGSDD